MLSGTAYACSVRWPGRIHYAKGNFLATLITVDRESASDVKTLIPCAKEHIADRRPFDTKRDGRDNSIIRAL